MSEFEIYSFTAFIETTDQKYNEVTEKDKVKCKLIFTSINGIPNKCSVKIYDSKMRYFKCDIINKPIKYYEDLYNKGELKIKYKHVTDYYDRNACECLYILLQWDYAIDEIDRYMDISDDDDDEITSLRKNKEFLENQLKIVNEKLKRKLDIFNF